jgi:hypothetical protein
LIFNVHIKDERGVGVDVVAFGKRRIPPLLFASCSMFMFRVHIPWCVVFGKAAAVAVAVAVAIAVAVAVAVSVAVCT